MVLVPESEYLALINLLKGGAGGSDSLQNEKAALDAQIQRNRSDSKAGADIKMKRHSWLYKQRHQLRDMIENKPQKVIVENATGTAPANIAPYMGIQKPTVNKLDTVDSQDDDKKIKGPKKVRRKAMKAATSRIRTSAAGITSYGEETDDYTSAPETDLLPMSKKRQQKFLELKTSKEHYAKMMSMIAQDPDKFGVDKGTGEILTNFKRPVIRSNYMDSLLYITGQRSEAPKGHRFFAQKLAADPRMMKFFETNQKGEAVEKLLEQVYYDLRSPASYAGIQKVLAEAQRRNPSITYQDVHQFLHKQRTYTLFKPRKNRFRRLKTVPSGLHTDWQCDLCIMDALKEHNDGFRYILVCIDVLSRKIFTAEVESKKSEHMIEAFEKIFKKADVLPNKLYSDAGLEFQAKKMKEYWNQKQIIKHVMYSPHLHAGVVERANRTIKERLYKYFSEKNTKRWVDVLDRVVHNLNNSANRTTGLRPVDVNFKNAIALRNRLYKHREADKDSANSSKLQLGDIVRISKEKGDFSKGYFPNFTDELFRISKVNPTDPPSYRIRDLDGEDIKGIFYEQELVKTVAETSHRAEVLKTRRRNGATEHFVRWIGYSDKHNRWIRDEDLVRIGIDEDDILNIKLVNPNYRFLDDKKFVHVELKVPSMQFSSVEHLRLTLNSLIREAYHQQIPNLGEASRTKRQANVTDLFFLENPVDYWEKIGEQRTKYEQLEWEVKQEENELSAQNTDTVRKKQLQEELPIKRLRMRRKMEELEELERAARRRDQESPENEQRKISEFFQHHPEDYNKKLNEARLIFTKHLSGLQDMMSKHIGEKNVDKIRQLNKEVGRLREKIKYLQRNLTIFENAVLQREHQKSLSEYESQSHQQNGAFVAEFFDKYPTNYWQIIHNNYKGLTEHFQKIEELQEKAVGLKDDASFQNKIERAKKLIEYRRKRFAALEFEAKKRDEQKQQQQQHHFASTAAASTIPGPTASALIARESLKPRTGTIINEVGVDDKVDDSKQTTTTTKPTSTHGEALREKLSQQKKNDGDSDKTDARLQTTTTYGEALREKIVKQKTDGGVDNQAGDGPQTTTAIPETHGEALKEKVLQTKKQHTDDAKPTATDVEQDNVGGDFKITRGPTVIVGLKQTDDQKKELRPPRDDNDDINDDDDDDDGLALKHGEMLWKLLLSTAPPNKLQTGNTHSQLVDVEHTRGQVLMDLLKNILEEKTDAQKKHHHPHHHKQSAQVVQKTSRGEALKELVKKTQNEQMPQSSAKTRGEILQLMLEHMKFSREEEVSFEKLVAGQQNEQTAAEFMFNDLAQRFVMKTGAGVLHVDVSKHLAYVLGFDNIRLFHGEQARYMPDLSGGVKQLYVYAPKLIEECIIGDRMAPLLRVVNVSAVPVSGGGTDVPEASLSTTTTTTTEMTHVTFNPDTINWAPLLALQQEGRGEMQYFVGSRYQRGAGLLKNVARFLMPVASNVLRAVSREGLTAGSRIAEDLSQGKALKESIQAHAKQGMENLAEKLKQCGKGAGTSRKRKRAVKMTKVSKGLPVRSHMRGKRQIIDQLTFAP
ncbi:hypothetical protein niasHT_026347 [Heterodera trifolii]|uniref:Integrase catalytic domain-containing protein n=1 Tax=Heterodera trifolii TaxID=157864 RepID=A0ABD2K107_9BILA